MLDPYRETGPTGLARLCEKEIVRLLEEKPTADRARRKEINKAVHRLKNMASWCKTRAGYRAD